MVLKITGIITVFSAKVVIAGKKFGHFSTALTENAFTYLFQMKLCKLKELSTLFSFE